MKLVLALLLPTLAIADDEHTLPDETVVVEGKPPLVEMSSAAGGDTITRTVSYRSIAKGLAFGGPEVGAEMRMFTAPSFAGMPLALTDIAVLTLRGRISIGQRLELFASTDILAKQPSMTNERVWQSSEVGANVIPPWDLPIALFGRASMGSLLERGGYWSQANTGYIARKALHEIMLFEGKASAIATQLRPERTENTWLVEAALGGSILFRDPHGWTGGWFGFHYALPLANGGAQLDPQPRIDLELGGVLSFVDNWDVFARFAIIDRGDAAAPATQLPILDGGFDQRQIVFGVTYHGSKASHEVE